MIYKELYYIENTKTETPSLILPNFGVIHEGLFRFYTG
jgi:hypothetical protein